jgi:hypothetical protein
MQAVLEIVIADKVKNATYVTSALATDQSESPKLCSLS